jgi:hypothetical protein
MLALPFHKHCIKSTFDGVHIWLHRGFRSGAGGIMP